MRKVKKAERVVLKKVIVQGQRSEDGDRSSRTTEESEASGKVVRLKPFFRAVAALELEANRRACHTSRRRRSNAGSETSLPRGKDRVASSSGCARQVCDPDCHEPLAPFPSRSRKCPQFRAGICPHPGAALMPESTPCGQKDARQVPLSSSFPKPTKPGCKKQVGRN